MISLLKRVPPILMEPFPNYDTILPAALPAFLADDVNDIGASLGYISGIIDHQNRVHDQASKVFKGIVNSVTYVERKSGDYILGKKAIIHFTGAGQKGVNEAQEISTDWFEYRSYNPELESFWVALSQTIVEIAETNIGNECLIRKAFKEAVTASGGDKVRYIASLIPIGGNAKSERKSGGNTKIDTSSRVKDDDSDVLTVTEVTAWVKKDRRAGEVFDEVDPKTSKTVIDHVVVTLNDSEDIDERYDKFLDLLDLGIKPSKSLKGLIDDALEATTEKKIACELFIAGAEELD